MVSSSLTSIPDRTCQKKTRSRPPAIKKHFRISNARRVKFRGGVPTVNTIPLECTENLDFDDDVVMTPAVDEWPTVSVYGMEWFFSREIGSGTYGRVSEYISRRDGLKLAIKKLNSPDDPEFDVVKLLNTCRGSRLVVDAKGICVNGTKFVVMPLMDGHISDATGHMTPGHITEVLSRFAIGQHELFTRFGLVYCDLTEHNIMFTGNVNSEDMTLRLIDIGGFATPDLPGVSTYPIPGEDHLCVCANERVCLWNLYLLIVMLVCGGASLHKLAHRDAWPNGVHPARGDDGNSGMCHTPVSTSPVYPVFDVAYLWKYVDELSKRVCTMNPLIGGFMIMLMDDIGPMGKYKPPVTDGDKIKFYADCLSRA